MLQISGRNLVFLSLSFYGLTILPISAQTDTPQVNQKSDAAENAIFLEAGGSAFWYSINYERILFGRQAARIGLTYLGSVGIPLLYNFFVGSQTHQLEIGLGVTFLVPIRTDEKTQSYATGNLSYRWVFSTETGLNFLRISFTPLVGNLSGKSSDISFLPWGGISFGIVY